MNQRNGGMPQIGEKRSDTDYAEPTSTAVRDPTGNTLIFGFGGWLKLERAAVDIAAANPELTPEECVNRADDVLRQCAERINVKRSLRTP